MNGGGFNDNQTVFDKFLDMSARVGVADFCLLSGIEPDFAFTNAGDRCGEPLLRAEVDHLASGVSNESLEEGIFGVCSPCSVLTVFLEMSMTDLRAR